MGDIAIRDATVADLGPLCLVRDWVTGHEAKLREASCGTLRFLVAITHGEVVGFASLFLANPTTGLKSHIPKLSDCFVASGHRSCGIGRALVGACEGIARAEGYQRLYVSVDPVENTRWFDFFRRRGYTTLQAEPYRKREPRPSKDDQSAEVLAWRQDLVLDLGRSTTTEPGQQAVAADDAPQRG